MIEPTAKLIHERFGSLVVGEGSDDVPEATVAQLAANERDPRHGRILHRRHGRSDDHGDRRSQSLLSGRRCQLRQSAKTELLGVPPALIETHGAVSPEVAAAMAEGVRNRLVPIWDFPPPESPVPPADRRKNRSGWSISVLRLRKVHRPVGSISARISRATSSSAFVQGRPQLGAVDVAARR